MRKLELSDIASYLPYDLDCHVKGKYENNEDEIPCVYTIIGFEQTGSITWIEMYNKVDYEIRSVKPILRPMTDLVKPIVVEGYNNDEEFVPLVEIANKIYHPRKYNVKSETELKVWYKGNYIEYDNMMLYTNEYGSCVYPVYMDYVEFIDLLNQWHFDYKDLIGQGLAVNINDLNKRI